MKVKTGLRVPGRVRKEWPTMLMFPCETPILKRAEVEPREGLMAYLPDYAAAVQIPRCTMPTPCGHCWYCKMAVAK